MKKLLAFLVLIISICSISCKSKPNDKTPEGATELFVKAFNTADFENMYKYSSSKSYILIKNLECQPTEDELANIRAREIAIDSTKVIQNNDSVASCVCYFKVKEKNKPDLWQPAYQSWTLQREGEVWKVRVVEP